MICVQESYSTEIDLLELEPYTEYLIQVAVSNYYTEYMSEALSKPTNFTTKPGGKRRKVIFATKRTWQFLLILVLITVSES